MAQARVGQAHHRGFTLIEIMVVAVVIVLLASVVNLAIPDNSAEDQAHSAAAYFDRELRYVAEQAVLKGETYALFIDLQPDPEAADNKPLWCYQWERVRGGNWEPLPELEGQCLSRSLHIGIEINDKPWKYEPQLDIQEPVLGFFPSGDATGDVIIVFVPVDPDASSMPSRVEPDDGETFWISFMGDTHWITEERRAGIETRIDHNRRWFK